MIKILNITNSPYQLRDWEELINEEIQENNIDENKIISINTIRINEVVIYYKI